MSAAGARGPSGRMISAPRIIRVDGAITVRRSGLLLGAASKRRACTAHWTPGAGAARPPRPDGGLRLLAVDRGHRFVQRRRRRIRPAPIAVAGRGTATRTLHTGKRRTRRRARGAFHRNRRRSHDRLRHTVVETPVGRD